MKRKNANSLYVLIAVFATVFSSCKKDQTISPVPSISLISISPASVTEYQDSIFIVISYKDGDGDLGENDASKHNLFIHDPRINSDYAFRIQQLAPDNANIAIEGTLNVTLPPTGITNGTASESVAFGIYVTDRKGNKSNTINTPSVTVVH